MSLKHDIYSRAVSGGSGSDNTREVARRSAAHFAGWCAEHGYKGKALFCKPGVAEQALQAYADDMAARGYSPATIHTRLAAPCKALGVGMDAINKPARTAAAVTRSRGLGNAQGKAQTAKTENARLVTFQSAVGVRRAELGRLRGRDLVRDESGALCVQVVKGKGGKHQLQRLLPQDEAAVTAIMQERGADALVFGKDELNNKIDLHGMRAEHARAAYDYYADRLAKEPGYRDQLRAELLARWDAERPDARPAQRQAYAAKLNNEHRLFLRQGGENYAQALEHGRPTEYDRLAVMAVSVFHLSHWRTDVTVTHYLV